MKSEDIANKYPPKPVKSGYIPKYAKRSESKPFPKKTKRSFMDLEVYQKTIEGSVLIAKHITPKLVKKKYHLVDDLMEHTFSIPVLIAEADGLRFTDFSGSIEILEKAMQNCSKTATYLDQAGRLYEHELDSKLVEDLMKRYIDVRRKIFNLGRAWKRFHTTASE
ncbi:MAG: four helix bundle protein [Candidatus Levyibacteriota bacterium]